MREFLTSRRARITPEQAGLPTYGTGPRRVPGLRREEVALFVYTAEPGSKSEEALNLLASWTATPDEEETHADHEEQRRHRSGA